MGIWDISWHSPRPWCFGDLDSFHPPWDEQFHLFPDVVSRAQSDLLLGTSPEDVVHHFHDLLPCLGVLDVIKVVCFVIDGPRGDPVHFPTGRSTPAFWGFRMESGWIHFTGYPPYPF